MNVLFCPILFDKGKSISLKLPRHRRLVLQRRVAFSESECSMEHWGNDTDVENRPTPIYIHIYIYIYIPALLYVPKVSYELARDWSQDSAVRTQRPTAWIRDKDWHDKRRINGRGRGGCMRTTFIIITRRGWNITFGNFTLLSPCISKN